MATALTPDVLEWLRRQAMPPPEAPPQPAPEAGPVEPPPTPPQMPQAAPDPMSGISDAMRDYVSRYASPEALQAVQAQARGNDLTARVGGQFDRAASLIAGIPQNAQQPQWDTVRDFVQRQQLAKDNLQTKIQAATMPYTFRKTVAETAKAEAEAPKIQAETEATRAGIPKTQAEARKATAEAQGSEIENGPAAPAMLAMGQKLGVKLPPDTTNKQAREIIDAEAKRQGIAIEWDKVGIEKGKIEVEKARYNSEHPGAPVPGFKYVGPGAPPARDSEPVKALADAKTETDNTKQALAEMRAIYDKAGAGGRLVGPDAQRLDTLHERLMGALGRAASGGRLAAYDVELSKQQLPRGSAFPNNFRPENVHAAIDTIVQQLDRGLSGYAKAHNFAAEGGQDSSAAPVRRFTRDASGKLTEVAP